jgi:hypothetical protein
MVVPRLSLSNKLVGVNMLYVLSLAYLDRTLNPTSLNVRSKPWTRIWCGPFRHLSFREAQSVIFLYLAQYCPLPTFSLSGSVTDIGNLPLFSGDSLAPDRRTNATLRLHCYSAPWDRSFFGQIQSPGAQCRELRVQVNHFPTDQGHTPIFAVRELRWKEVGFK